MPLLCLLLYIVMCHLDRNRAAAFQKQAVLQWSFETTMLLMMRLAALWSSSASWLAVQVTIFCFLRVLCYYMVWFSCEGAYAVLDEMLGCYGLWGKQLQLAHP